MIYGLELNFVGEDYAECIRSFQQILIKHCLDKELNYIHFSKKLSPECFMEDGIHFNEIGHKIMADLIKDKLDTII